MKRHLMIMLELTTCPQQEPRYWKTVPLKNSPPPIPAVLPLKYVLPWTSTAEFSHAETAPAQHRLSLSKRSQMQSTMKVHNTYSTVPNMRRAMPDEQPGIWRSPNVPLD